MIQRLQDALVTRSACGCRLTAGGARTPVARDLISTCSNDPTNAETVPRYVPTSKGSTRPGSHTYRKYEIHLFYWVFPDLRFTSFNHLLSAGNEVLFLQRSNHYISAFSASSADPLEMNVFPPG